MMVQGIRGDELQKRRKSLRATPGFNTNVDHGKKPRKGGKYNPSIRNETNQFKKEEDQLEFMRIAKRAGQNKRRTCANTGDYQ